MQAVRYTAETDSRICEADGLAELETRPTSYTVCCTQDCRHAVLVLRTQYRHSARHTLAPALLLPHSRLRPDDESSIGRVEAVWGRPGITDGRFQTPRAIAIDRDEQLYIVDKTARIQVFKTDGTFLRSWSTPDHAHGKPTGLSFDRDGNLMVADTHYFQVLVYSPEGKLLRTLGGKKGEKPGEFGFVTGTAQDSQGNLYVSEYGEYDRIQKFAPDGRFLLQWGGHGSDPGQFVRPQKIVFDADDHLWVTDAGNHRIQVFDTARQIAEIVGKARQQAGRALLSLRHRAGPARYLIYLRVRQPSHPEVHPRRPLLGLLGPRRTGRRGTLQSLGRGAGQAGEDVRVGYE